MSMSSPLIAPENRPGNVKFEKIWNRAKDCDVASVVLHANNNTLCMDGSHALTADEVIDCCKHGCIIESEGVYYRPAFWAVKGNVAAVQCIGVSSGSSGTPVLKLFGSYRAEQAE